ncbi:hypothetical protein BD413DRAFT_485015 [Trametes elegans]|nr:hypothetical protein BD413DRAFT_485015 [Trametes elegans]
MISTVLHMPRPTAKRASRTWPGDATVRSHFEDFLHEIGADVEETLLCCKGTSPHPHGHHGHTRKGSTASKARSSPSRAHDKARASTGGTSHYSTVKGSASSRGRTMSIPSMSVPPKSPALSSIDLENHDATATHHYLSSARDALLVFVGGTPVDERPSRSPTRTFFRDRAPASHSPDSRTSPSSQGSRTRPSARSPSRTPSIDSLDTASSSEAPATPRTHSPSPAHELAPTLEDLERTSRFRVESVCVRCRRAGSNFPSCAKCGERWCSRECRLQGQLGAAQAQAQAHACHHGRAASA